MSILTLLSLSLALSGATSKPNVEAKKYAFDLSGTTTEIHAGKSGVLKLQIKPATGFHVSPDAPLKISLRSDGLKLSKQELAHGDADEAKAQAPNFKVDFDAAAKPGPAQITADATFFVCSESICERQTEKLTVAVSVQP